MPNRSRGAPPPQPTTPKRLTTTQQGLGWSHQQDRERLIIRHPDGKPCWWCGRPMYKTPDRNFDGKPLHADHPKSRSRYGRGRTRANRLLHDTCNKQRGDGTHDHQRPALTALPTPTDTNLGQLAMPWPWHTPPQ